MEKIGNKMDERKAIIERFVHDLPVLRARLGVSQAELADEIGVSRQTYNCIETGKRELPVTTFLALIAVFMNNEETRKMLGTIEELDRWSIL